MEPWEQDYDNSAPWERDYGRPQGNDLPALNKYPDFVDLKDRAIIKNFASHNPAGAVQFLRERYPNAQFRVVEGEIEATQGGEWMKLDPSFTAMFSDPAEIGRDLLDIGSDVVGGIGEGAATVAGALAGTAAAPGVGTMAGAMGASGVASAASEGVKHSIGAALGVPDNFSGSDIALAGGVGLASPLLFGAGKLPLKRLAEGTAQKIASKTGKAVTQEALDKLSRGVPGRAWDGVKSKVLPSVAGATSGVPTQYWNAYAKHFKEVNEMIENPSLAAQYSESERMAFKKQLEQRKRELRGQIVESLKGKDIDINSAKESYLGEIARLRQPINSQGGVNQADASLADVLEKEYKDIFGVKYADDVRHIGQTDIKFVEQPPIQRKSSVEYEMPPRRGDTYGAPPVIEKRVVEGVESIPQDPKMEVALRMATLRSNPAKDGVMNPLTMTRDAVPSEIPNTIKGEDAFRLQARLRNSADYDGPYKGGAQRVARESNEALRESMETATGGRSQDGKDAFSQLMYAEQDLLRNMQENPQAFYNEMSKIPNKANIIKNEGLSILGVPMTETREKLAAHKMFADPATNPISSQGVTATARADAAAKTGQLLGAQAGGAGGQIIGEAMARGLVSPKAYVGAMKVNRRFEDIFRHSFLDKAYNPAGNMLLRESMREDPTGYFLLD